MKQIAEHIRVRPTLALLTLGLALAASPAFAGVEMSMQDRDVARSVSLGGSCNRCELSGRNLSGATFTGASFMNATLVGANLRGADLTGPALLFVGETAALSAAQLDVRAEVAA